MQLTEIHFKVLETIETEGGETRVFSIATRLGIKIDAARKSSTELAEEDYLDLYQSGKCVLLPKGEEALAARGRA
jgi:Mn-dependent DtxR family transcriptional regulator